MVELVHVLSLPVLPSVELIWASEGRQFGAGSGRRPPVVVSPSLRAGNLIDSGKRALA